MPSTRKRVDHAHEDAIWAVDWKQERIATGSLATRGRVKTWRAAGLETEHALEGHALAVVGVSLHPSAGTLVTGAMDSTLRLWDLHAAQPALLKEVDTEPAESWAPKFSPDGTLIAATGQGGVITFYAGNTLEKRCTVQGAGKFNSCLAWSLDGSRLAVGSMDGSATVFDTTELLNSSGNTAPRRLHAITSGHALPVRSVAFAKDALTLLTASDDGKVMAWDMNDARSTAVFTGHESWVMSVATSPVRPGLFCTGGADGSVRVWDSASSSRTPVTTFRDNAGQVWGTAFNEQGTEIASVCDAGSLVVYSL